MKEKAEKISGYQGYLNKKKALEDEITILKAKIIILEQKESSLALNLKELKFYLPDLRLDYYQQYYCFTDEFISKVTV